MPTVGYIKYRSEYKYQLAFAYRMVIPIRPKQDLLTDYIELTVDGTLTVAKGYAWDGPSGPVKDTEENLRASLVHDALYQLMRHEKLSGRTHRKPADQLFKDMCKEDGVSNFLASTWYKGLRKFGRPATMPRNKKKIRRAPTA